VLLHAIGMERPFSVIRETRKACNAAHVVILLKLLAEVDLHGVFPCFEKWIQEQMKNLSLSKDLEEIDFFRRWIGIIRGRS
jgi:hypothetical protein